MEMALVVVMVADLVLYRFFIFPPSWLRTQDLTLFFLLFFSFFCLTYSNNVLSSQREELLDLQGAVVAQADWNIPPKPIFFILVMHSILV